MIDVTQTLQNYEERISNLEHENAELKNMLDLESTDTGLHELLDRMKIIERDQNQLYEKFSALVLEFQARKENPSTSPAQPLMNIEEIKKEHTNVKIIIGS